MNRIASFLASATVGVCLVSLADAQVSVLYDTGVHQVCVFNGASTNLGWTSGDASATQPQRWTPQPFTLPAGNWLITEIAPEYFVPAANPTDIAWRIWTRVGDIAPVPADEVASGSVPFSVAGAALPVSVTLPGGDYYLTIYAIAPTGTTIGWFTNAQNGIHFIEPNNLLPFMWRSSTYPVPGFAVYQLPAATLSQTAGLDPNKLYCAAFIIRGQPAPVNYCTAGVSVGGCVVSMGATGKPTVGASVGYNLTASNVPGQRNGLIFYSVSGRNAAQWGTGSSFLCIAPPSQRMTTSNSGGTAGACDGTIAEDWLVYLAANPGALGAPFASGVTVNGQCWYRDPGASKNTNLSDGLEWITLP